MKAIKKTDQNYNESLLMSSYIISQYLDQENYVSLLLRLDQTKSNMQNMICATIMGDEKVFNGIKLWLEKEIKMFIDEHVEVITNVIKDKKKGKH